MHPRLTEQLDELNAEHEQRIEAYAWASETLEALNLTPLLDLARLVTAWPLHWREGRCVNIFFNAEQKPDVMPLLTASTVTEWGKTKWIQWTDRHDGSYGDYLYVDFDYRMGQDEVTVRFISRVKEGDEVDGCTVKKRERMASSELFLACDM